MIVEVVVYAAIGVMILAWLCRNHPIDIVDTFLTRWYFRKSEWIIVHISHHEDDVLMIEAVGLMLNYPVVEIINGFDIIADGRVMHINNLPDKVVQAHISYEGKLTFTRMDMKRPFSPVFSDHSSIRALSVEPADPNMLQTIHDWLKSQRWSRTLFSEAYREDSV